MGDWRFLRLCYFPTTLNHLRTYLDRRRENGLHSPSLVPPIVCPQASFAWTSTCVASCIGVGSRFRESCSASTSGQPLLEQRAYLRVFREGLERVLELAAGSVAPDGS